MKRIQYYRVLVAFILSISLISCEDDDCPVFDNTCNVSNPAVELDWLKQAINDVKEDEYSYFVMATYQGETVFYYGNCNPLVDYISFIQNCNGEIIGNTNDFMGELTDITIIWKHKDSECSF
jgi:hypothetical protein